MKKRFLFVFVLLSMLTLAGCKDNENKKGTLSAPQEVVVQSDGNKSLIIFDEVDNAEYYYVYINDTSVTVKGNGTGTVQYDASKIISLPQKYTIKVKAGSEKYFDSTFSPNYEYHHTSVLNAPVISVDGTILNWNKVDNADSYEVLVTTSNPTVETTHTFPTNKFDFSNILVNKGEYWFKVRAISESDDYSTSTYSNTVNYTHTITLTTPYNLITSYDLASDEMLLTFVSNEDVDGFIINIDGTNHNLELTDSNKSKFLYPDDLKNMYILKLSSFVKQQGIKINNSQVLNVSIKAVANGKYLQSSEFSSAIQCEFNSVLATPGLRVTTVDDVCKIVINPTTSTYLSSFAIYLNDEKYKTISKEVTQLELPLTEVGNDGIRVQAISNNNNCYSSNLSDVAYAEAGLASLEDISVTFENGLIKWNAVSGATNYYVEVSNTIYRHAKTTTATYIEIPQDCECGYYNVKVIAFASGYKQSEVTTPLTVTKTLDKVNNLHIETVADATYLYFDKVLDAYGYVIHLNGNMVTEMFTSSPINITPYIASASSHTVQLEAISNDKYVINSGLSNELVLQNVKTLSSPKLSITKEGEIYYLNVDIDESESALASGYEIWINYQSSGVRAFEDAKIDITSNFVNAGEYNFMVKAIAVENNQYVKDSNIASISYKITKQLDTVTGINVTRTNDDSRYMLTFNEQTMAAKYLVTIVKADDASHNVEFELNGGVADISQYVTDNGVYKVYVKAIALQGGYYTDSATSGNPYRLVKGETLPVVENIHIDEATKILSWNNVPNCSGYQVYIYYNHNGKNVLKKSVRVQGTSLDIGAGEYNCLTKEGSYSVQIKALGDNQSYETSQIASVPYTYTMTSLTDFERNTVFIYGNTYNYKVTNINELKNLLWYHYLYNEEVWSYNNSIDYNLKIYFDDGNNAEANAQALYNLALEVSEDLAREVGLLTTNADKMYRIAKELLKQYPEISAYSYATETVSGVTQQRLCYNEADNIYIFRYQDVLDKDKLKTITSSNTVYNERVEVINSFEQRSSNYVFAIDRQQSIDVATTEQLFMALQYNKAPNFVGDSAVAEAVYENARFVLRQICSDAMSDYEKTLQIYNFLTKRIAYNYSVTLGGASGEVTASDGKTMRGNVKDFYLEGVLYNSASANGLFTSLDQFVGQTAVCDGLSKAFVALCSIEGIDAIKVEGTVQGSGHSWNKVYIDIEDDGYDGKQWYVIDSTNGRALIIQDSNRYQVSAHNYFLIDDSTMASNIGAQIKEMHARLGAEMDYSAKTSHDYYENQVYTFTYDKTPNDNTDNDSNIVVNNNLKVSNNEDIEKLLFYSIYVLANQKYRVVLEVDVSRYLALSSETNLINHITQYYSEIRTGVLGGQHNCNIHTEIKGNYAMIAIESVNYKG